MGRLVFLHLFEIFAKSTVVTSGKCAGPAPILICFQREFMETAGYFNRTSSSVNNLKIQPAFLRKALLPGS